METAEMPGLILTSDERLGPAGDRWVQRAVEAGRLVRVRAGIHVEAAEWESATHDQRALVRTAAVIRTRRRNAVLSHESAALVLGIPIIGARPQAVHLVSPSGSAPPSERGVVWHRERLRDGDVIEHGGFTVTSPERTMFDLVRSRSFTSAVTGLDAALAGRYEPLPVRFDGDRFVAWEPSVRLPLDDADLAARLDAAAGARGIRAARRAIEFADARSASAGESLSRAQIHLLGFPPPELQAAFARPAGGMDITDFYWPDFAIAGEFDGFVKYHREEYLDGMAPEDVIWLEKERERRLRREHGLEVSRWVWDVARTPHLLKAELLASGLPIVRR